LAGGLALQICDRLLKASCRWRRLRQPAALLVCLHCCLHPVQEWQALPVGASSLVELAWPEPEPHSNR